MTFYDLLDAYEFVDLENLFKDLYSERFGYHITGFEKAFEELKKIDDIIETDCFINIQYVQEEDIKGYEHVNGKYSSNSFDIDLSLTPWSEWLGMKFTTHTLNTYTIPEIICHCIWEMTFYGYNEIDIKCTRTEFKEALDDFKSADILNDIEEKNESRRILTEMLKDEIESSSSSEIE